jgi:hypothetical protein
MIARPCAYSPRYDLFRRCHARGLVQHCGAVFARMMIDQAKTDNSRQPTSLFRAWIVKIIVVVSSFVAIPAYSQNEPAEPINSSAKKADAGPQAASNGPPRVPTDVAPPKVEYVGPDTYILLDSAGRPQLMPGMTYEDFLAAWKKLNEPQKSEIQPRYTIESLDFSGRVVGQRAELECVATVQLLTDGATDTPMGLVGAILQGEPHFKAVPLAENGKTSTETVPPPTSDRERLTYDPDHGGFVARFVGHSGDKRKLTLGLIVPLQHEGSETTLPLNCPRALSSQLTVSIDSEISEARANTGALVSQVEKGGDGTDLKVAGPAGIFRLTWQSAAKNTSAIASVLNALSAIHITVDGRGIRSDARLTVRSFGGTFDQFRVRLPPGAQLIQARPDAARAPDAQYHISMEPDTTDTDKAKAGQTQQIVVVELPEKQKGPVVVDLATEQSGGFEKPDQEINLAGFEVVGAVRQFGDVSLSVGDDWQARWQVGPFVRQVDPSELDASLQSSNPTAAFQYDRQPWLLKVQVAPRRLRLHVTPKFELECLPEESRLVVHLAYQFFGARAFELRVDLKGWEMTGDPVESGGLVDQDRMTVTSQGTLILPLSRAASRRVDVTLPLRRAINRDTTRLELPLPVPTADSVGTGDLIVRAAPNIELLPDLPNSVGLTAPPDAQVLLAADNGATELRFRTLLPSASFVTDRTRRAGEVTSQASAQVELTQDAAEIDERINYSVRFEPLTELAFELPPDFSPEAQSLDIQLLPANENAGSNPDDGSTALHINPHTDEPPAAGQSAPRQIRVMLPRPQIGKFLVRLRYRGAVQKPGDSDAEWFIPLVRSADGESKSQSATVLAPRNLSLSLDDNVEDTSWKAEHSSSETQRSTYIFRADGPELSLPLIVRRGRSDLPTSTIVDRVWLQTWLANGVEQDRAAFRFRTAANEATVELPPDLPTSEIETLVDRQPAEVLSQAHGRLVVRLPSSPVSLLNDSNANSTVHTLELRSRQPYRHGLLQLHRFTPSQLQGSMALSQVYWQIILPGDEHVIQQPGQLTSASQWQWLGSFWGREPLKSQPELEDWVGASRQVAPAESQTQYLFSGLMPVSTIEIATAPRWLIVLAVSSAVLLAVLALLYTPRTQRLWVLAVLACLVLIASISYPEAAMLIGEASLVGLLLSGLSLFLGRSVRRRTLLLSAGAASSHRMATPRADSILMPAVMSAASSAPTVPLRVADSKQ